MSYGGHHHGGYGGHWEGAGGGGRGGRHHGGGGGHRYRDDSRGRGGYHAERGGGGYQRHGPQHYGQGGGGYQGGGDRYYGGGGRGRNGGRGYDRDGGGRRGGYGRGRGGRGRGGRGRGGGRRSQQKSIVRFHDTSCEGLNREVLELNRDHPGPQQIRVLKFNSSPWEGVESLTKGNFYYHNRCEKKPPMKKKPKELKDLRIVKTEYRAYTVSYADRPRVWPLRGVKTVTLKTNSFMVSGRILDTLVHQFEVTFDPPIESENVTFREKVVLGACLKEKRHNHEQLRQVFGEFQFDNHALYAMGHDRPSGPVVFGNLRRDYKVTFHHIDSFRLSDPNIPIQQQEALLNIFNRKRLQKAGYSRIGRGWFRKGRGHQSSEILVTSNSPTCPDVKIISGFECSMRILPKHDDAQLTVFKADLSHKLVEKNTLRERLEIMRRSSISEEDFRERASKELLRRHFLLSYNKRNLQIHEIDWAQDENSMFELQTGGKISYKDYLQKTYGVRSPRREMCVVKDKGGAAFLPQHIRLTITSKQSDAIYDEVLMHVNPPTEERLNRIEDFVQNINQHGRGEEERHGGRGGRPAGMHEKLDMDFEIEEDSVTTPAYVLEMPRIVIMGENGPTRPQPVDDFRYSACRGFLEDVRPLRQWGVVFERDPRRGQDGARSFWSFKKAWEDYCKKRRFHFTRGPIACPHPREVPDILDEQFYAGAVQPGDELLLLILPEGLRGSEAKARFTKYMQSPDRRHPVLVQCIQASTCEKSAACMGTFEDIMIKFGNVPYRIEPCLPHGDAHIDVHDCWCAGMDVSHVSAKPSVVMLSLSRDPFQGSLRSMHHLSHLNPSRKEIVAFPNMVSLMYAALVEAFEATKHENRALPRTIFFFRDGVADGQLQELFTKEVVGVQRALTKFREDMKLKKWRPALEYILCNKNTIDRLGRWDERTNLVRSLTVPCVVFDHILSYRLWDFVMFPYHKSKKADRTKGVRYIVLVDGLKLAEDRKAANGSAFDLFQFIFGLTYMFAFSVPFPLGGTAQPAPIQYAKHYAESYSQHIFKTDKRLRDLAVDSRLNRPHIVQDVILDKPTEPTA